MLPDDVCIQLASYGIHDYGEVALREALERYIDTYTLFKLAPWPARRWKCHYRVMMGEGMYDAQTVSEAYALALLAALTKSSPPSPAS